MERSTAFFGGNSFNPGCCRGFGVGGAVVDFLEVSSDVAGERFRFGSGVYPLAGEAKDLCLVLRCHR